MIRKLGNDKKGMSIVISTIIIVAISITMAIAISFWAMGIGNSFTRFERLEIQSAYAEGPQTQYFVTTGSGATATANIDSNGVVTSVTVVTGGSNYVYPSGAVVSFSSPGAGGQTARATAVVSTTGIVTGINVIPGQGGSGYTSPPTVTISPRIVQQYNYLVYLRIKNTGSAAATINNVFLDGKPYDAPSVNARTPQNLISVPLAVGATIGYRANPSIVYLPSGNTWNSGNYVEIELETVAGRLYSTTVVLP